MAMFVNQPRKRSIPVVLTQYLIFLENFLCYKRTQAVIYHIFGKFFFMRDKLF